MVSQVYEETTSNYKVSQESDVELERVDGGGWKVLRGGGGQLTCSTDDFTPSHSLAPVVLQKNRYFKTVYSCRNIFVISRI